VSQSCDTVCFLLWGSYAQAYEGIIRTNGSHLVLKHSHPSPLARRSFVGCDHFRICNEFLVSQGKSPINWTT
jgi:uracil-DNA glycosylase